MFSTLTSLFGRLGSVKNILQSPRIILYGLVAILLLSTGTMYHLWKESRLEAKIERSAKEEAVLANAQLKSDYNALIAQTQEAIEKISQRNAELEKSHRDTDKAKAQHRTTGRTRAGDVLKPADIDLLRKRSEEVRSTVHSRAAHSERRPATKNAANAE